MNSHAIFDELDQAIDQMMAGPQSEKAAAAPELAELLGIASDLRHLPRPDFKMRLKAELEWQDWSPAARLSVKKQPQRARNSGAEVGILPTLLGNGYGIYPIRRANFVASIVLHAAAIVVLAALGMMVARVHSKDIQARTEVVRLTPYFPMTPSAKKDVAGGGGGGDRDKLQLSAGGPPKVSMKAQLTPPVVIPPKEISKIMAEPTVVADLKVEQAQQVGDQLSKLMAPSNGTGASSGVGSGSGGGYGSGKGRGYGPGSGYGYGGGVGGNGRITQPKLIYSPDPEFSEEARKAKYQGIVILTVLVGADGRVHDAHVSRSLGMGLDEKAVETVKSWKFEPARTADGSAVAVYASIEVNFHLY
jgi:TonB family protein